jgi:cyclohexanecarboxyl-CoA dehydrogenase
MDPTLSDDLQAIQTTARRFAAERVAPGYMAREASARIDRALIKEIGQLGLIAPEIPEHLGGLGLPSLTSGLIAEAIGHADINVAYLQILGSLNSKIIAEHASRGLAEQWLPKIAGGDAVVCIGLTEPRGGSDAANLALSARRDGNRYVLKGEKSSISMADQSDAIVLFARTGPVDAKARGVSAFLVPMNTPGITTQRYKDLARSIRGDHRYSAV